SKVVPIISLKKKFIFQNGKMLIG
ncbi:hypothetical protein A5845_002593, partial [Enterococcus faecium]